MNAICRTQNGVGNLGFLRKMWTHFLVSLIFSLALLGIFSIWAFYNTQDTASMGRFLVFFPQGFSLGVRYAFLLFFLVPFGFFTLAEIMKVLEAFVKQTALYRRVKDYFEKQYHRSSEWMERHFRLTMALVVSTIVVLFTAILTSPAHRPVVAPLPAPLSTRPTDRVLIHFGTFLHKHTLVPSSNMVGKARVRYLGHGRYLIQLRH